MQRFSADRVVSKKLREYLGSSKCTLEYTKQMSNSVERYDGRTIPGLYAIIVPSGGGKTTACRNWGFIDIDEIIGCGAAMERLILDRREMIRWGTNKWKEHNEVWYEMAHSVLSRYDFSARPWIIMVHTEEMAYEIGATPVAALIPGERLKKQRLRNRNELERMLAMDNLKIVEHRTKFVETYEYNSWKELDQYLACLVWESIELAAPLRAFTNKPKNGWPLGYDRDTPMWIMRGEPADSDGIATIQKLRKEGMIPGVCESYYTTRLYGIKSLECASIYDFKQWLDLSGEIVNAGSMGHVSQGEIAVGDLNKIYPYESVMASNKRNVGLRRLMENLDVTQNDIMMDVLMNRRGSNQNLVTSIIVWVGGIMSVMRPEVHEAILKSRVLLTPDTSWIKITKKLHDMIRTSGEFFGVALKPGEVQRLMYLHMLYGRFTYEVDEKTELDKRTRELDDMKLAFKEGNWSSEEYNVLEVEGIRDAYRRLCDALPASRLIDFIEFWNQRRNWLAKGSTTLYEGEKKYILKFTDDVINRIELRHNKKSLLEDESECNRTVHEIVSDIGRNDSKMVPKYESAAKRALMPSNLYHYLVFSYVLYIFEECAAVGDVRLGVNRDESFKAFDDKLETNLTRFTYDFADFNSQHSRKSMARAISLLGECIDPNNTMSFCLRWLSISFGRMELIDREGKKHRVKSGLYSGWRGTTWINSVLNHAYMYVARACYMRLYATDPFIEFEGAGDDVDGLVSDISVAGRLYRITNEIGLESNVMKQLFGQRAEFLRVSYQGGYAGASVCRTLGNFISGNWEGEGGTVEERMTTAIESILTLGRRGISDTMVHILYRSVIGHLGRIFDGKEWLGISKSLLHGRKEDNCFGIPDDDGCIWTLKHRVDAPEGWKGYIQLPRMSASRDWCDVLEKRVKEMGYGMKEKDRLTKLLAEDSYDISTVVERFCGGIDPKSWVKYWTTECEVESKIKIENDEKNDELLFEFFEWLHEEEDRELRKIEQLDVIGRYVDYLTNQLGEKVSEREWYGELYEAHLRVEKFSAKRWKVVRCPAIVLSKIARWCKVMIAKDMITVFEAESMYRIVGNTYGEMFSMEL